MYLVLIMRGNYNYFPKGYFISCNLISSFIQKILMPSFILHNKISFYIPEKLALSSVSTQGRHKFENDQTLPTVDHIFQWLHDTICS